MSLSFSVIVLFIINIQNIIKVTPMDIKDIQDLIDAENWDELALTDFLQNYNIGRTNWKLFTISKNLLFQFLFK